MYSITTATISPQPFAPDSLSFSRASVCLSVCLSPPCIPWGVSHSFPRPLHRRYFYRKLQGQSHCLLLVEPVLLPNLGHTGVDREISPGDRPLFYPNGQKKCGMGDTVRNALYQSTTPHPVRTVAAAAQQQQEPPSDWAGSSAYFSPSEESSSCFNNSCLHPSNNQQRWAMKSNRIDMGVRGWEYRSVLSSPSTE